MCRLPCALLQASQKEESYSEQMRVLIAKHKEVRLINLHTDPN